MLDFDLDITDMCPHCGSITTQRIVGVPIKGAFTKKESDMQYRLLARKNKHKDNVLIVCTNCPYSDRNYIETPITTTDITITKVNKEALVFNF